MNKLSKTFILMVVVTFLFSCKKNDNNTTTDPADKYVGNWTAKDTVPDHTPPAINSYSFVAKKKSANELYFLGFLDTDTLTVNVSGNSLAIINSKFPLHDIVLNVNGNTIKYTYQWFYSPVEHGSGSATKQ